MYNMRYIGDVHGKWNRYKTLIKDVSESIQVGDFGVGFMNYDGTPSSNPPHRHMTKGRHRFIRGNHDNPGVCKRHSQWIPDGTVDGDHMFIGGAFSVDRHRRTEGCDWWADEECSHSQMYEFMDTLEQNRPRVMITHEAPIKVLPFLHSFHIHDNSRTQQALQVMWELHQPEVWIFGHHHVSFDMVMDNTRFICLNELEHLDL